jgi:Protein of unknown function (DUF3500)/Secretion system C-terminal sorting domain
MKNLFPKIQFTLAGFIALSILAFTFRDEAPKTVAMPPPPETTQEVVDAANAFKATLTAAQIASLEIAWTTTAQARWSNLPCGLSCRNGLLFSSLTAAQVAAANVVIKAAAGTTAEEGFAEFSQVRAADTYLGGNYSEGNYIIAFLGTPSITGRWLLQFGGHHYAQNIAFNAGKVIGTTPSHQGVEPLTFTNTAGTFSPLKADHAGMLAMLSSLTTDQLVTAKLAASFSDVSLGPGKDGQFPATKVGLKCNTLTAAQKALVLAAMKSWTQDADDASGTALQTVYANELDETYIAFSGAATLAANGNYVRIDGPSVWIELVCQNGVVFSGIHYHAIYRDHTRDYGASGALTGVRETYGVVSESHFKMDNNYPNPFTNVTTVPFTLKNDAKVQVKILDLLGREVAQVMDENRLAGSHSLQISRSTSGLAAGSYLCQMVVENNSGRFLQTKLIIVQ